MAKTIGNFKVNPANVSLTWTPVAFNYGRALTTNDLNATAIGMKSMNVPGIFVYTDTNSKKILNIGDILNAGSYSINVSFTPTSKNYNPASINALLVVNKNTITMAFTSVEFVYGTPLSTSHFNATAKDSYGNNVVGTFVYTSDTGVVFNIGDIIDAGTYNVIVTFTATTPENYTNGASLLTTK